MKRWLNLLLMLCLLVTLCACRAGGAAAAGDESNDVPDSDSVHNHVFGSWTETVAPSCSRVGNEMAVCDCGEAIYRVTPAKGHSFVDWTVVKTGTCTTEGYEKSVCANGCGAIEHRASPFTHTYGKWIPFREYIHSEWMEGERRYCACGEMEERQHVHEFNVLVEEKAPTCGNQGYQVFKCACDDGGRMTTYIDPTKKHVFGPWAVSVAPSLVTFGEEYRNCTVCGQIEYREMAP